MTPNELYAMKHESIGTLNMLNESMHSHISESDINYIPYDTLAPKVEIRIIKYFEFDYRRFWRLATVWYEDKPVMIIRNAGREGDDHSSRIITDKAAYVDMIRYIRSLLAIEFQSEDSYKDPNEDIVNLDSFYGNSLSSTFVRHVY